MRYNLVDMLSFLTNFAATCTPKSGNFFGFPTWYKYLVDAGMTSNSGGGCRLDPQFIQDGKLNVTSLSLVGFGILDILLRLAAIIAVGYIVYAGFQYITAQGEPEKAKRALGTIINALIGLGITIVSAAAVSFVGARVAG